MNFIPSFYWENVPVNTTSVHGVALSCGGSSSTSRLQTWNTRRKPSPQSQIQISKWGVGRTQLRFRCHRGGWLTSDDLGNPHTWFLFVWWTSSQQSVEIRNSDEATLFTGSFLWWKGFFSVLKDDVEKCFLWTEHKHSVINTEAAWHSGCYWWTN